MTFRMRHNGGLFGTVSTYPVQVCSVRCAHDHAKQRGDTLVVNTKSPPLQLYRPGIDDQPKFTGLFAPPSLVVSGQPKTMDGGIPERGQSFQGWPKPTGMFDQPQETGIFGGGSQTPSAFAPFMYTPAQGSTSMFAPTFSVGPASETALMIEYARSTAFVSVSVEAFGGQFIVQCKGTKLPWPAPVTFNDRKNALEYASRLWA